MSQSLIVMAKWPELGQVKTRLAEVLGTEPALAWARAFLEDTLLRLASVPVSRKVLAYSPAEAETLFAPLARNAYVLRPQVSGDLGIRMQALLLDEWQAGCSAVLFVGADTPTLPLAWITDAFEQLARADVVLGPAVDGGYYLLGCRRSARWIALLEKIAATKNTPSLTNVSGWQGPELRLPIFEQIDWGTPQVLPQTLARLQTSGLRLSLLPVWYDVDTATDLAFLGAHVRALRYAGLDPAIPRTEALLSESADE